MSGISSHICRLILLLDHQSIHGSFRSILRLISIGAKGGNNKRKQAL